MLASKLCHPALKYLRCVRDLIANRWYDIGLELLEQKDEKAVNIIKKNNAGNITECCIEMLELWLNRQSNATWNQLIDALKAPGIELNMQHLKLKECYCHLLEVEWNDMMLFYCC